jgi:hypothetical protein
MALGQTRLRRLSAAAFALVALGAAALAGLAGPAAAEAKTTWLCKPGQSPNPCDESLRTTYITSDGVVKELDIRAADRPRVDCFYVYPTVSDQPTINANLTIDPQQTAIARFQASRFSQRCRVFAPIYRQLTLTGIYTDPPPEEAVLLAYGDVRRAWREYWRNYNNGRGVVLIGHSQGAGMLTQLIREKVDGFPKVRRQLVSALLMGGNVTVEKGSDVGGAFQSVPACRRASNIACVVAYSVFNQVPPPDSAFGRVFGALVDTQGRDPNDLEVLCNNPAALRGGSAPLQSLVPTSEFPGTIGLGVNLTFNGAPPTAPTPWVEPQDHYTGRCLNSNGANVLMISPVGAARTLLPVPDPTWGIHLGDVNLALGNLVNLVKTQSRTFVRARAERRKRASG